MTLFGPSVPRRIRASLQVLVNSGRYALVAHSDAGMVGAITYRSPVLWIAAEWDRSLPWLSFSPTHHSVGQFSWVLVDLLLTGAAQYDRDVTQPEVAEPEKLAEWLEPRLSTIEDLFTDPKLRGTNSDLQRYRAERGRAVDARLRHLQEQYANNKFR